MPARQSKETILQGPGGRNAWYFVGPRAFTRNASVLHNCSSLSVTRMHQRPIVPSPPSLLSFSFSSPATFAYSPVLVAPSGTCLHSLSTSLLVLRRSFVRSSSLFTSISHSVRVHLLHDFLHLIRHPLFEMAPTTIHRYQHDPSTAPASSTKTHSTSTRFLFRTAAALVLSTSFTLRTFAQNPSIAKCSAYTTVDEKTLYVQGGNIGATSTNQFYALDLTVQNFTASNPPWKALSLGAGGNNCPSMTLSANKQNLLVWNSPDVYPYNMATNTWQISRNVEGASSGGDKVVTVADSTTGTLYALAGASGGSQMLTWAELSDNADTAPMPEVRKNINGTISRYAAAWSSVRGTLLVVGGLKDSIMSPYLFEFNAKTRTWSSTVNISVNLEFLARTNFWYHQWLILAFLSHRKTYHAKTVC